MELRAPRFSLRDTLECGQTFCWYPEGPGYVCSDVGQVVYVEQHGNVLHYETSDHEASPVEMFRLYDPLDEIQTEICKDDLIRRSIAFAPDLRIIKDPFFPCLVSFICSIRNNIPSIRRTVQMLREHYGPRYKFRGKTYYGFPEPENLAGADVEVLRRIGLDWRAEFVVSSSRSIASGDVTEEQLRGLSYEEAHSLLKTLYGVGDKVSDCVCLFSLGFLEAFPIDVWIERVIQDNYGILASAKAYAKKSQLAREYFGRYAGYAQEYLYYYSRNNMARTRGS